MGAVGGVIGLVGVTIGLLSAAGAPAYLFEDVMGWSAPRAYGAGAVVWAVATVMVLGMPTVDYAGMVVLQRLLGVTVRNPITIAGVVLTVFYVLAAVGFTLE